MGFTRSWFCSRDAAWAKVVKSWLLLSITLFGCPGWVGRPIDQGRAGSALLGQEIDHVPVNQPVGFKEERLFKGEAFQSKRGFSKAWRTNRSASRERERLFNGGCCGCQRDAPLQFLGCAAAAKTTSGDFFSEAKTSSQGFGLKLCRN